MSNLKEKLKLAMESGKAIAKNVSEGKDLKVSDQEFQNRMVICRACPLFKAKLEQCGECGCFLQVKARLNGMECPLKKW